MNILMLAWRDMKHPQKGGAEVVTDVYLSGLAKKGHNVILFSSSFPGSKLQEDYNGYKIIRKGGKLGVYVNGLIVAKASQDNFDVIIDQVNTIPFFTPLAVKKEKRVAFFHQLCLNVWFYETPFPISIIGNILERLYLKLYRKTRSFVVSNSTKEDLVKYCWLNPKDILVLENQIDFKPLRQPLKNKKNQFVFCGRLVRSKRVHDCIKALYILGNPDAKLYIIGDGPVKYKYYLDRLIEKLNLKEQVIFTGKIPQQERNKIMAESQAILVTSVREGWGLIITEANANGTLAITYNVEGLRDANKSGILTKKNNPRELAKLMYATLDKNNKDIMLKKSKDSIEFAKHHNNWNTQVEELEKWLMIR